LLVVPDGPAGPAGSPEWSQDSGLVFDVLDDITDGLQFFRVFIGNFDAKFFFEGHDELNCVEGICSQIFDEGCGGCDLFGIHAELLDDDIFDFFFNGFFGHIIGWIKVKVFSGGRVLKSRPNLGNKIFSGASREKTHSSQAVKRYFFVKIIFFRAATQVEASPQEVCRWHENPHNLRQVTPPWIRIDKIEADTTARTGREFALELAQCGLPMRWRGRWLTVQRPRLLIDGGEQTPFPFWRHAHHFHPHGSGTLLVDEVTCAVPFPWSFIPGSGLVLRFILWLMFLGRHTATRRFFRQAP